MRVVSWNVRALRDDRSRIVTVLRDLHPDVVCLQEAPRWFRSRTQLAALARNSGLLYVCGGRAASGPALLVAMRVDVEQSAELRFPQHPRLHRRGLAAAVVRMGDRRIAVVSVHLGLDAPERVHHASQIRRRLDQWEPDGLVVAGDLNETSGRPAWVRLSDGLVDVAAAGGLDYATFPADRPRSRIDAIFVSPGIAAAAVDPRGAGLDRATDHLPVVVDIDVRSFVVST